MLQKKSLKSRLYDWCMGYATSRWSVWILFLVAFLDAAALAIPTPLFLMAAILLNPVKAYRFAGAVVLGAVAGAVIGYFVGQLLWLNSDGSFSNIAMLVFNHVPGVTVEVYEMARSLFAEWGFWILFAVSFVPAPQTLMTVLAGVLDINILIFIAVTLICQLLKYFVFTWCILKFGERVKEMIEVYYRPIGIAVGLTFIAAIAVYSLY